MTGVALSEPQQAEVAGVPAFWGDAPGLYTGALMFRVGQADETLARSGITHLVEHLAMFPIDRQAYAYGAFVDETRTVFYARGEPHEVAEFLEATARNISALPFERLSKERRVLRAELANHPGAHPLWRLRFGPAGFGLPAYDELGLHWLPPDEIEAWSKAMFTRQNAAMWFSSEPPADLDLDLPSGQRMPTPLAVTMPDIEVPAFSCLEEQSGIGVSLLGERSAALSAGSRILAERTRDRLRRDLGLTYSVTDGYWRLNAGQAHLILQADATPGHAQPVLDAFLGVLDDLALNGPAQADLDRHALLTERYLREPQYLHTLLSNAASSELFGRTPQTLDDLIAETNELTVPDVASALSSVAPGAIMALPRGVCADISHGTEYGATWGEEPVEGREAAVIFEGDHALSIVTVRGEATRVEFETPQERSATIDSVLRGVSPDKVAHIDLDAPGRAAAVHELAARTLGSKRSIRVENALARVLLEGESPRLLAWASWSKSSGLLALTDTRLVFVSADTGQLQIDLEVNDIAAPKAKRGFRGGQLQLLAANRALEISAIAPPGPSSGIRGRIRACLLVALARSALRERGPRGLADGEGAFTRRNRSDGSIDRRGGENPLDHHHRGSDHAGAVCQLASHNSEVPRRQRQRALVDDFADPGQELLLGLGDVPADDNHRRVDEVHGGGKDLANQSARFAHQLDRRRLSGTGEVHDGTRVGGLKSFRAQPSRHRAAAGKGLQAAHVPAGTGDFIRLPAGEADMPDVSGGPVRAAVDGAVHDDTATDARPDLDEEQMVHLGPLHPVLTQRHDVHVVVYENRDVVAVGEPLGNRVCIPTGHDRRITRAPGRVLNGAGDADADAAHVVIVAAGLSQQDVEALVRPIQDLLGTASDLDLAGLLREDLAAEVGQCKPRVGGPEIGSQDHAGVVIEGEHHRWAPAGRLALTRLAEEAMREELLQPLRHGRAREPGSCHELGASSAVGVANQLQHRPRAEERSGAWIVGRHQRCEVNQADFSLSTNRSFPCKLHEFPMFRMMNVRLLLDNLAKVR